MKHWPPRFSGLFWSGGFAHIYTAHRAKDQYVKAGTDSMRVRFVQGAFSFPSLRALVVRACACRRARAVVGGSRARLRVRANVDGRKLGRFAAAWHRSSRPADTPDPGRRTDWGRAKSSGGDLMPLAIMLRESSRSPAASYDAISCSAWQSRRRPFLTDLTLRSRADLGRHAVANTDDTVSFKRIETLDRAAAASFRPRRNSGMAKLANPAPEAK